MQSKTASTIFRERPFDGAFADGACATDKIELPLGGTWSDYPEGYQTWFMSELFRAPNDDAVAGVAANPMLARPGIHAEAPAR